MDEKRPKGREKSKIETVSKVVINSKQTGTNTSQADAESPSSIFKVSTKRNPKV